MTELKEVTKELKPKSFRIDDDLHEKFKEISANIGGNQQEAFSKLIEAYELQQGKLALKEESVNIEQFEKYLKCLLRIYIANVEDKQNLSAIIRTDYEAQLKSKEETIIELQSQLKKAKEIKEEAVRKSKDLENKNWELNNLIEIKDEEYKEKVKEIEDLKIDKLADNAQIKTLINSCDTLSRQLDQMKADVEETREQEKELENLQKKYDKLKSDYNALEVDLNDFKLKHEDSINKIKKHENEQLERVKEQYKFAQDKALLELKEAHLKEIKQLQDEHMAEMKEYFNSNNYIKRKQKNEKKQKEENVNPLFNEFVENGINANTNEHN